MPNYDVSARREIADLNQGMRVDRDTAVIVTGSNALFTVTGGNILLLSLVGEIVATIDASLTIHIDTAPTAGTATALCVATADINTWAAYLKFTLPAAAASALTVSTGDAALDVSPTWLIPVGTINLHASAGATLGSMKWSLFYVPAETGAYVTAA